MEKQYQAPDLSPTRDFSDDDDYEDDLEDEDSEWADDAGVHDLKTRFREASAAMKKAQRSFSKPEALYDFLYEFRDVASQATEDGSTLLHLAIELAWNEPDVRSANMVPLIQHLMKEHPHLLTKTNLECRTPLYMAIFSRKSTLVEALTPGYYENEEWRSAVQDALEIPCASDQNKAPLHLAFERNLRFKTIENLIDFAKVTALSMQDAIGKTPLHYAVEYSQCNITRTKIIRQLIHRDEEILATQGTQSVETFLDIVDEGGNSVYRHHVASAEKFHRNRSSISALDEDRQKGRPVTKADLTESKIADRRLEHSKTTEVRDEKLRLERRPVPVSSRTITKGDLHPTKLQDSKDRAEKIALERKDNELDRKQEIEKTRKAKEEAMAQHSRIVMDMLQLHYMRTRSPKMALSFLYGRNLDDVQITFDYAGLPSEIKDEAFKKAFQTLKFNNILQYVSFPAVTVARSDRQSIINQNHKNGRGRRDMEFFFKWLYQKGVRYIINVRVDDGGSIPHSDESIISSLEGMGIERLDWRKVDLDPRVICKIGINTMKQDGTGVTSTLGPQLREVTLRWSGNNAVLRAWSEPEGLPALPSLTKISLHVPAVDEMIDSLDWTRACLAEFRERIAKNVSMRKPEPGNSKASRPMEKDEEGKEVSQMSSPDNQERDVEIYFIQAGREGERFNPSERVTKPQDFQAAHRWLDSVYRFSDFVQPLWRRAARAYSGASKSFDKSEKWLYGDVVVAMLDDGVDAYDSPVSNNIIGGKTFAYGDDNEPPGPYYVSESGHGTVTASMITRVCPMAKLYSIRLKTIVSEQGLRRIEAQSAAMAIQAAIDREATIILMPWSITIPHSDSQDRRRLEIVFEQACKRDIIMFCSSSDSGPTNTSNDYPVGFPGPGIFRIGAAREDGSAETWTGAASMLDFIFPGSEVIALHDADSSRRSTNDKLRLDVVSGSSVAAALGAGLAALLLYCFKLNSQYRIHFGDARSGGETLEPEMSFERHSSMMSAFRNLGPVTDERFIKVWETLNSVTRGDPREEEAYQLLARLTRNLRHRQEGRDIYGLN